MFHKNNLGSSLLLGMLFSLFAFGQATPVATIPVGDAPYALAITADNTQATVVNLFPQVQPDGSNGPNIKVVDLVNRRLKSAFNSGTRLVAVAITGTTALIINEDQDALRVVNIATATQIGVVPVGSRPSNVSLSGPNRAVVTNGTSGDITFVDLSRLRVIGNAIKVGNDPRAVAVHPGGRYAYVALGGDNKIAVIDLNASPQAVIGTAATGKNPVAIAISPNGQRAVSTNLTNNTVTIFNLGNSAAPNPTASVPVCVEPNSVAVNPIDQNLFYVGCLGSNYFAVLDVSRPSPLTGVVQMGVSSSGIRVGSDGLNLYVTEFQNAANLRIYDLKNMPLDPAPSVDIPGEPQLNYFLDSTGVCSSSFYVTTADLADGQKEGFYSLVVAVSGGLLTGGFNLGGGLEANGQLPGFGQFKMPDNLPSQPVAVQVNAQALPGTSGSLGIKVEILQEATATAPRVPVASMTGPPPINFTTPNLAPGTYYVVQITSLPGSPRSTFQMSLISAGFSGGVVVGGLAAAGITGYGGYCVPVGQTVNMVVQGASVFGDAAAGDIIMKVLDPGRNVLRTLNTSVASFSVAPPNAPPVPASISFYVDASAPTTTGTGTATNPFRSITQALSKAPSNSVIFVRAGKYSPSATGEIIPISAFKSGMQLIGAGSASTIIDAERNPGAPGESPNGVIIAVPGVRFAGFTVKGSQQIGVYVTSVGNSSIASNAMIEQNFFTSNLREGFGSFNAPGLIVRNNVLLSNLEDGMVIAASTTTPPPNPPTVCPPSPSGRPYGAYIYNNISNDARVDGMLFSQGGNACVAGNSNSRNGSSGIEFNNRQEGSANPGAPLNGVVVNNTLTGNGGVQFAFAGTGVLSTEGAKIDLIQSNTFSSNRPTQISVFLNAFAGLISNNTVSDGPAYGIVVQRRSQTDEISDNTCLNNLTGSGLFVEDGATVTRILRNTSNGNAYGLQVLANSTVATVDSNNFDRNNVGIEVAGSGNVANLTNNTVTNSSFSAASGAGVFVRQGSTVGNFDNKVKGNHGQAGMVVDASRVTIGGTTELSSNTGNGLQIQGSATVTITPGVQISSNQSSTGGGLFMDSGAMATLTGVKLDSNATTGILAGSAGTVCSLGPGNSITNTTGFGLNAQNGAAINCSAPPTFSGNTPGDVIGNVNGCGQ